MADFFQNGVITTLQELGTRDLARYENELLDFAEERPVALVISTLYPDLERAAIGTIIRELASIGYLTRIVVSLGGADRERYLRALELFKKLPQKVDVIWNDGERIGEIVERMQDHRFYLGEPGKGMGAWMAYGLILGDPKIRAIALHDSDILSYDRFLLHRLVYPILNPLLDYEFCKGYYARLGDRLYGRVTRLFFTPLIRALQKMLGRTPFLVYLDSFRYPLAGEFCMNADVARVNKIPSNWGLEIGTVSEVFKNYSTRRVCQVDLGMDYEHRHQGVGVADSNRGILRMARETSLSVFHSLASEGVELGDAFFRTLRAAYSAMAHDAIRQYADLSMINGLYYDRDGEESFVEYFTKTLDRAVLEFSEDSIGSPDLPNWNQVKALMPDVFERIGGAVKADARSV